MEKLKVEITFNNYQESDYSRTKRFKNLRKLLFLFAQSIYSLYISLYILIRSRVFFVKEENFSKFKEKIKFNNYTNSGNYFDSTRLSDLSKSFNLKVSSPYYYEGFFKKNTTRSGLVNYILFDAFLKLCLEKYYDDEFCVSKFSDVEINILDMENGIFNEDYIVNSSNTMEIFVSVKNKVSDPQVKRILEDKLFVKYINEVFRNEIPFIHISGIAILGD
ncbi:hypothetical protein TMA_004 [Thermus phage TMA]|uniref:hypothetical protein n=1 Tax=Thermus phage TMA TaxID=699370 RepID=UPI00021AAE1D|nr:hypothetical protein TMA_004 [Thermus phage TMA]BAK53692.1 hypothetical protein TMA_004 [Thermus phage TMA]